MILRRLLAYDQTGELNLDDPITTEHRKKILRENSFLNKVYRAWYVEIQRELPAVRGGVLELGSGAGFLREYIPGLITSELLEIREVDLIADALALPIADRSLRAIVMTNVLHHIPSVERFFHEADRCLTVGGRITLIEPWMTDWSRFIYTHFHHEPIDPETPAWGFTSEGPVSSANEALPWIIFSRDRARFEREFPQFKITRVQPIMPLLYLLSGGYTSRLHFPGQTFRPWTQIEKWLSRWRDRFAMFAIITLTKI